MIKFISDIEHYDIVLNLAAKARRTLWIGTADIKDLYVMRDRKKLPFLAILSELIDRGVEIRLIHAKEPGCPFRKDFDRYPLLAKRLERSGCFVLVYILNLSSLTQLSAILAVQTSQGLAWG